MDKDHLLEEITEGLNELSPLSSTIIKQSVNGNQDGLYLTLIEIELIIENLASYVVALKRAMR
ncbi:MAG: hypothetical protein ACLGHN_08135 [Bacteriovoracia bacterium]